MFSTEKEISYTTTNSYSTLNHYSNLTKNVWFVCHGMHYLSRYFLKYFKDLNKEENYIIAPQAPSKCYLKSNFKHVGASWLTKENTLKDTDNIMRYFDEIMAHEKISNNVNLIVLGYSQGVSVTLRYVVKRQLKCAHIIIMSGGVPAELTSDNFKFLNTTTKIIFTYGDKDEYFDSLRIKKELNLAKKLFGQSLHIVPFEGTHAVNKNIINTLTKTSFKSG